MKVCYYGHVGERSGYGVAARAMCRSLLAAGVELEIRPFGRRLSLEIVDGTDVPLSTCLRSPPEASKPDVTIVHTLPMDCANVLRVASAEQEQQAGWGLGDCHWVAYTTWEGVSSVPDAISGGLSDFDDVWSPSRISATALSGTDSYSVRVMPHAYDPSRIRARDTADRSDEPYRFLWSGAWTARKNPGGLLRAWAKAFRKTDPVELWLHSTGVAEERFAIALHQTGCGDDVARVRFLPEELSDYLMSEQYRRVDCFVTATRGEAWNLPAFEAMLHGCHVIAPTPAGSDEFLEGTSAMRYRGFPQPAAVDVIQIGEMTGGVNLTKIGAQGLDARSDWLEPDLDALAGAMLGAFTQRRRHIAMFYDPADRFSYEAVGKLALQYLEDL